ncbi:hypothetical protein ARMGADRAFT_1170496 [Armillaria gallica]|uniref:Uncharacterized protein n=1 Tax=Armillaria gallica TaxID=47427 RepID=A0A2H3CKA0_ARMGA|nr:hypothetical protein ARMGADRAFT_1170496 [Armillaria gallica]
MVTYFLFGLVCRLELVKMFMEDLHRLRRDGIIPETTIKIIGDHAAEAMFASSTPKWYRETMQDLDFIVSDARNIEKILVETYPDKYSLDLEERSLNMSVKFWDDPVDYVRLRLMSVSYLPENHPATSTMFSISQMAQFHYNFDVQASATLLDLIVLKIGGMVTKNRHNPKREFTDGLDGEDLENLAQHQNTAMQNRPPLDATASSGEDLHAIYLYVYYDHPKVAASSVAIQSWLSLGPGNSPSLLDAQGNTVLQDGDRAGMRSRWESEEGDNQ